MGLGAFKHMFRQNFPGRRRSGVLALGEGGGLVEPAVALDPALEVKHFVDTRNIFRRESRDLREAGDAERVELLFEHGADAGDLLEIVGDAFGSGEERRQRVVRRGRCRGFGLDLGRVRLFGIGLRRLGVVVLGRLGLLGNLRLGAAGQDIGDLDDRQILPVAGLAP